MQGLVRRSLLHPLLFAFLCRGSRQMSGTALQASSIEKALSNKEIFLLDGGTGEELFRRGLPDDRQTWSAKAISDPQYHDLLKSVHQSFLAAGSNAITTNSYGITEHVGFSPQQVSEYCQTAAQIARQAIQDHEAIDASSSSFVLGSLGPLSESYRPDLILPRETCIHRYGQVVGAMHQYVDCFLAETMGKIEEATYAMEGIAELCPGKPMMISFTLGSDGKFRDGEAVPTGLLKLIDFASKSPVKLLAILFNCAEPEAITTCLKTIHEAADLKSKILENNLMIGAYANRLTPVDPDWTIATSEEAQSMRDDLSPERYCKDFVSTWTKELDVRLVGGCCGITPEHIQVLHDKLVKSII